MANINFPLTFSLAPFPTGAGLNADEYGQQLVSNLQAFISGNFLTGQIGGTQPTQNIGPWLNGNIWWFWNPTLNTYTPPVPTQTTFSSIRNGSFQIWQRGTSFTNLTGSSYTADAYIAAETLVTGVATVSRQSLNLTGTTTYPDTAYGLRIAVTTAQITITANESFSVYQLVERINARDLFDKSHSLSLVLQSSLPGTYCVCIRDAGVDWSYVVECVITEAGVPQSFSFPNIPTLPTASGNWGTNETDPSYSVSVTVASGSSYQTTSNVWNSGNFVSTTNQTNLFATIGNTLDITLIQHEPGVSCTPFVFIPFDEDLRKCQRYYTKSHNYDTNPNQFTLITSASTTSGNILTFTSTTGSVTNSTVTDGMVVFGTNITLGTTVSTFSPTTVTLSAPVAGTVGISANIVFVDGGSTSNEMVMTVQNTTTAWGNVRFPVKMRTISPTLVIWSILYGNKNTVYSSVQNLNMGGISTITLGDMGFDVLVTSGVWTTTPNFIRFQYTSSADL